MECELYSAPEVVKAAFSTNRETVAAIAAEAEKRGIYDIVTAARGTSHHAAICFKVFAEVLAGKTVAHTNPSTNNVYNAKIDMSRTLYVVVSQSGGSPDTINMLKGAKENGAMTVAVTNNAESEVVKLADYTLYLAAGEEKAVAATKTFTTELAVLLQLAAALGKKTLDCDAIVDILEKIKTNLPDISRLSSEIAKYGKLIVLSRGVTEGVARECGLKLTETTYKMTYTGSANEFQHGPKAMIEKGTPVILLAPSGEFSDYYRTVAGQLKKQEAYLIALTDIEEVAKTADIYYEMPRVDFFSASITYAFAIQAAALYTAEKLGLNPDAPRNLNKVTITE